MTNDEAIKGLKCLAKAFDGYKPNEEMFRMAIEALEQLNNSNKELNNSTDAIRVSPSVLPMQKNVGSTQDCVDRQEAIDTVKHAWAKGLEPSQYIEDLSSVQPEPLSDAYMKAVWTWLLNYQIKVAELQGRYTPYEVLSWVANDWRKEHDGSD